MVIIEKPLEMKINTFQFLSVIAASCSLGAGSIASAQNSSEASSPSDLEAYFMQDYMLGDWSGLRTDLSERGFDFEFYWAGTLPSNLSGGIQQGTAFQMGMLLAMDVDTEKAFGWGGGHLHTSAIWLDGDPFSTKYVGDLNKSNLVDFPADFRLWQVWFEQEFWSGKFRVKAGLMSVDRDFILPESYSSLASINLLNQTFFFPTLAFNLFDIPGFPQGNHALPSTPYNSLGALIRWQPVDSFYLQAAVYDGNPDTSSTGTRVMLQEEEGALMYYEAGVLWNRGKDTRGLPGSLKIGGYYHTDEFFDIQNTLLSLFGLSPAPTTHSGNYGGYLLAEQMLYREQKGVEDPAAQGLTGFFRLTGAPADRNLTQMSVDGGLVFKGLVPGRDYDTLSIAASYLEISDDIKAAQRTVNSVFGPAIGFSDIADFEGVIELTYKFQIAAWWTLAPSLQYAIHPGGSTTIDDAWILSILTTLRF